MFCGSWLLCSVPSKKRGLTLDDRIILATPPTAVRDRPLDALFGMKSRKKKRIESPMNENAGKKTCIKPDLTASSQVLDSEGKTSRKSIDGRFFFSFVLTVFLRKTPRDLGAENVCISLGGSEKGSLPQSSFCQAKQRTDGDKSSRAESIRGDLLWRVPPKLEPCR